VTQLPELLRDARPVAPSELRERVRLIAAPEPVARRRVPWRRVSLAAVPAALAAAAIAGVVVGLRDRGAQPRPVVLQGGAATADSARAGLQRVAPTVLPPSSTRFQDYRASLTLEVPNANAVSDRTKRAVRIAQRLGGSVARVDVGTSGRAGNSYIVLRVPVDKVTTAVAQLGALGRIVDQHVAVVDVQQRIRQLREKVRTTSGEERKAAQQQLFQELRRARLSTISLELRTPEPVAAGPHHESTAGRILHVEGRVALYTALIGGPLLALGLAVWLAWRGVRRASERRLLGA
jgi:signal transduction histidine kinase